MSSACEILLTDSIYRVYWYHATDKKNWLDTVQKNEVMVHIGTKPSARTMAKWNQREHIYVVTVDPAAQVENALVEDTNDWDDYHKELRNIRYLNRWESPGQVSLLVEAKHLSLVRVDTSGFGR